MSRTLPSVYVLILSLNISLAIGQEREMKLVPNADLQQAISVALSSEENFALSPALQRVLDLTNSNPERVVRELLFYATQFEPRDSDESTKRVTVFHLFVKRLNIEPHTVMYALVPYLDSSDEVVRETVSELLNCYENLLGDRSVGFSHYQGILASSFEKEGDPPTELIRHMYATHPTAALLTLLPSRVPEDREGELAILLAEHSVTDVVWRHQHKLMDDAQARAAASEHLRILAGNKLWWVRCYPAYIMKSHPALRIEDIVRLLRNDTHKAVAGVLQFAEVP